jgi:hypothetical protein
LSDPLAPSRPPYTNRHCTRWKPLRALLTSSSTNTQALFLGCLDSWCSTGLSLPKHPPLQPQHCLIAHHIIFTLLADIRPHTILGVWF